MPFRLAVAALAGALASTALAASPYRAPRTPDGRPDLQGEWTNATWTPLQRNKDFAALTATEAEAKAYLQKIRDRLAGKEPERKPGEPPPPPNVGEAQSEWPEKGEPELLRVEGALRSSIITDPTDGRLPYNALGRNAASDAFRRDDEVMDGPEDRIGDERCLMAIGGSVGPPMLPPGYNAHYRIVQTPDHLAVVTEMIHDVRLVRMNAAHEGGPPRWGGDSVGRWEGETLVVDTVGQHPLSADRFVGPAVLHMTPAAHVEERFTRTSASEIRYAFTVDDPAVFSRAWRGELVFRATDAPMFEYACHEGNHALPNILAGARKKEADAKLLVDKAKGSTGAAKAKAD